MSAPLTPDPVLADARVRARAGAWREVLALLEPTARGSSAQPEYATLYGEALMRTGRARDALAWLRGVEPALARSSDRAAHRTAVNLLGAASFAVGELDDAARAFETALELGQRGDDLLLVARASNNLGAIANLRGGHERAVSLYELAIPAYQRLGQARGLAESYHNLAITYRDLAQLDRADECERRAIEFAADGQAPAIGAKARLGRGEIALRRGDSRMAEVTARRAAIELARLGDLQTEADAHRLVGAACAAQGRAQDAHSAFAKALGLARTHGYALVEAETLRDRAKLAAAEGRRNDAHIDARDAIVAFDKLGALEERTELERWIEEELEGE